MAQVMRLVLVSLTAVSLAACSALGDRGDASGSAGATGGALPSPTDTATLAATPDVQPAPATTSASEEVPGDVLLLTIGDTSLTATLADNSSVDALRELLADGPLTVDMSDYGAMEKVGPLGTELPRNDERITAEAGDLILYQGDALVIYYAPNSWNFTRLGRIDDVTEGELRDLLGDGDVRVTLSLPRP